MSDDLARIILLLGFAVVLPVGIYHRLRSHTDERIDRRQEGWAILVSLRLLAFVCLAGLLAFLIRPDSMAWASFPLPGWARWMGVGLGVGASGLVFWTFRSLGHNLTDTVVTRRNATLVTHGPYRWVRHPFYLAFALAVIAVALITSNGFLAGFGTAAFLTVVLRTSIEEQKLVDRFGTEYVKYMRNRPVFAADWSTIRMTRQPHTPGGETVLRSTYSSMLDSEAIKRQVTIKSWIVVQQLVKPQESTMHKNLKAIFLAIVAAAGLATHSSADEGAVKVFILAGQSNMEGKASNDLLDHQATDPKTEKLFAHLRRDNQWIVRDDVFIKFLNRRGGLTIGYGSPNKTGAELEFGTVMGDHFEEPVLLIKAAWGGHSLYQKFRPPGAGLPSEAQLQKELEQAQQRVRQNNEKNKKDEPLPTLEQIKEPYGSSYRAMMKEVQETFENYETMFPELKGKKLELAGFVWFQGFNDMFGDAAPGQYESNMKHFINDVRKDLSAPNLPFVIGALGQNGSTPVKGGMLQVADAQMAMNDVPEFQGNVKAIRTDVLADKEAERLFPGWQDHVEEWKKVGSDRPYHYLGSAIWFNRIGNAFGQAMLELMADNDK